MPIVGIGVDVVDLARFERALARTPKLRDRLFTALEQSPNGRMLHLRSLAGRFAAKEAFMKALGESTGVQWHDMQVVADGHGNPSLELSGAALVLADARAIANVHLSMSHDAGVAIAYVVAESTPAEITPPDSARSGAMFPADRAQRAGTGTSS